MADSPFAGLLSQYGLNLTADQMRQKRVEEAQVRGAQLAKLTTPTQEALPYANIGAMLGGAIVGNRAPDEDVRKAQIAVDAQKKFEEWSNVNKDVPAADRALQYQKFLGEAAFRNGFADLGATIMGQYDEASAKRQARDMELEKLGYETRAAKRADSIGDEEVRNQKFKWGQEEYLDVFPAGSDDPNAGVRLRIDDENNAIDSKGNIIYRDGEWTRLRPEAPAAGTKGSKKFRLTDSEAGSLRGRQESARQMVYAATKVDELLKDTVAKGGKEGDVISIAGNVASAANKIAFTVDSVMNNVGDALGIPRGGVEVEYDEVDPKTGKKKTVSAKDKAGLMEHYGEDVNNVIQKYLPRLNAKAENADLIRNQLLVIAGAIMRTREPGNARFSDNDFKYSLDLAGQSLADPNILRETLRNRVAEAFKSYDIGRGQIPREEWSSVWSEESINQTEREREAFFKTFGAPKATSAPASGPVTQGSGGWSVRVVGQ